MGGFETEGASGLATRCARPWPGDLSRAKRIAIRMSRKRMADSSKIENQAFYDFESNRCQPRREAETEFDFTGLPRRNESCPTLCGNEKTPVFPGFLARLPTLCPQASPFSPLRCHVFLNHATGQGCHRHVFLCGHDLEFAVNARS